ncbi:uroporphyrinogen-III synthase, partial [Acinetobacter guillouiae]|uniref:uroporphyrinogen-III synthase n=1 Tax=Acinetobacter guillouiae TaxID=106649 RepID=UPI003AF8C8F2
VGKKTAQRLLDYGVESHVPEVETSEGMLSLPLFNQVKELKRIAIWRGEGGRQFMMQQCQARQNDDLNYVLYDRAIPQQTQAQF